MLPTTSKSLWFEQGSSFISLEDIMVGVQFTPRQRAFMVLRFAALFKFSKNLEGDLGEHHQPLLRSGTTSRSIVMKELAKIFVHKSPSKFLLNLSTAVRFCKSQNHKGSLTWYKLHTHHNVFQTDK